MDKKDKQRYGAGQTGEMGGKRRVSDVDFVRMYYDIETTERERERESTTGTL